MVVSGPKVDPCGILNFFSILCRITTFFFITLDESNMCNKSVTLGVLLSSQNIERVELDGKWFNTKLLKILSNENCKNRPCINVYS